MKYVDITEIVKRLNMLYYEKKSPHPIDQLNTLECRYCHKIAHEKHFTENIKRTAEDKTRYKYINTCKMCTAEMHARNGLKRTIEPYVAEKLKMKNNGEYNEDTYDKIKIEIESDKYLTQDVIKLKTMLNLLTNKLRNYDAS